jgi:hypothetical protein
MAGFPNSFAKGVLQATEGNDFWGRGRGASAENGGPQGAYSPILSVEKGDGASANGEIQVPGVQNVAANGRAAPMVIQRDQQRSETTGWHPEEARHRQTERRVWVATFALTAILAVGAVASAIFTYEAAETARLNFVDTTRAWLAIDEQFQPLTLEWRDGDALVGVGVLAVNKGPSPALSVSLSVKVDEPSRIRDDASAVQRYCVTGDHAPGATIFPNQKRGTSIGSILSLRLSDPQDTPMPPSLIQGLRGKPYEVLEMAVCVTYKILGDHRQHHTLQYFYLGKPGADKAKGLYPDPVVYGENLSDGNLIADFDDSKGFAD